jgi:hypothetical protein
MALVTEVTAISSAADWQSMVKDNDKILGAPKQPSNAPIDPPF